MRLARLGDAEAIADIYNREVLSSTVTFDLEPRSVAEQRGWLADRGGAHSVLVAEDAGQVVGFASLSPYRDRPGYRTTVENSVYVHHEHRGRGLARQLLIELLELARASGFHAVMARVVGGHHASIALHESVGFEVVGVEREVGRKFGRWLDVVLMQTLLQTSGARDPLGPST